MPLISLARDHISSKHRGLFRNVRIAACLHVSKETAVLLDAIHSLGAEITLVAANPLSTQNDIASFLESRSIHVSARSGETEGEYLSEIIALARSEPDLIVDDGGELHAAYSKADSRSCFGGTDETTTGTQRLRALAKEGRLQYPVIPVNEARTKHIFDNKYGSGQSGLDGLLRATGLLVAGKTVVVAGYGWVGKGVAKNLSGLGARVLVTEIDSAKALEAHFDGHQVLEMAEASSIGDLFVTCTGQIEVLRGEHFQKMKNGAILANIGHFDKEIWIPDLYLLATKVEQVTKNISRFDLETGNSVYLLSQGRVVNLVAAEGHPPEVMQLSFANQLLSLDYLLQYKDQLKDEKLLNFPKEIDSQVSEFALRAFGLTIDSLTNRQKDYARRSSYMP
jgi:adenosylhomocysteinase